MKSRILLLTVISVTLGVLIGLGTISFITGNQNQSILSENGIPTAGIGGGPPLVSPRTQDGSDFQHTLTNLLQNHISVTALHLQAIYDGKDATPTAKELSENKKQLAELFNAELGLETSEIFMPLWHTHITEYEYYTRSLKVKDQKGMDDAKKRLSEMANQLGLLLNHRNSQIQAPEVTDLMNEHINLTLSLIDSYSNSDRELMSNRMNEANTQAVNFASFLDRQINAPSSNSVDQI